MISTPTSVDVQPFPEDEKRDDNGKGLVDNSKTGKHGASCRCPNCLSAAPAKPGLIPGTGTDKLATATSSPFSAIGEKEVSTRSINHRLTPSGQWLKSRLEELLVTYPLISLIEVEASRFLYDSEDDGVNGQWEKPSELLAVEALLQTVGFGMSCIRTGQSFFDHVVEFRREPTETLKGGLSRTSRLDSETNIAAEGNGTHCSV